MTAISTKLMVVGTIEAAIAVAVGEIEVVTDSNNNSNRIGRGILDGPEEGEGEEEVGAEGRLQTRVDGVGLRKGGTEDPKLLRVFVYALIDFVSILSLYNTKILVASQVSYPESQGLP